ncbi:MAG: 1-hydroxycarotenoid 3,4-desaturase CrtD [Flavobacteriales bacterium]
MSQQVIIIGSGIAGLSAAIRLRTKGYQVDVFEANDFVGGKLSEIRLGDFRFDAGPSLFTMPQWLNEIYEEAGRKPSDYYTYKRKEVVCTYWWEDGTRFIAYADADRYGAEAERVFGEPADRIRTYFQRSARKFDLTEKVFLQGSLHRWSNYFNRETARALLRSWGLGLTNQLHDENARSFQSPHLIQLFDRYATYNGSSPYLTPGIMSMIPHLEQHYGTFIPEGGMVAIVQGLKRLADELGVQFHMRERVTRIVRERSRVVGIETESGSYACDAVVSNMDVVPTYRKLMPDAVAPEKTLQQERSSSALIFYWAIGRSFPELDLHNIFFTRDYVAEFKHIFETRTVGEDPTVYVNIASKDVPADAPAGKEAWFVMVNVPSNTGQDWDAIIAATRQHVIEKLSRLLNVDLASLIEHEALLDPRSIESRTSSFQGALYGSSSNDRFAAFLRHPNFSKRIGGLYFCGGSSHPGGGIPLCVLSGKIAAELLQQDMS